MSDRTFWTDRLVLVFERDSGGFGWFRNLMCAGDAECVDRFHKAHVSSICLDGCGWVWVVSFLHTTGAGHGFRTCLSQAMDSVACYYCGVLDGVEVEMPVNRMGPGAYACREALYDCA